MHQDVIDTEFIALMADVAVSVTKFDKRFKIATADTEDEEATLFYLQDRLTLLTEELGEHAKAVNHSDLQQAAYELGDILFTVLESIHILGEFGLDQVRTMRDSNDAKTLDSYDFNLTHTKLIKKVHDE